MTPEIVSVVLTGAGVLVGVLFGVWRMLAHYETRNDAAHAELGRRIDVMNTGIDKLTEGLSARIDKLYELLSARVHDKKVRRFRRGCRDGRDRPITGSEAGCR